MEETKKEELFCAIYMAVQHGFYLGAKKAFEKSMDETVDDTLEHVIQILEKNNTIKLIEDIRNIDLTHRN